MDGTGMVHTNSRFSKRDYKIPRKEGKPKTPVQKTQRRSVKQDPPGGLPLLLGKLLNMGVSQTAVNFIKHAWRPTTRKSYTSYINQWITFCVQRGYNMRDPELGQVVDFLMIIAKKGKAYKTVNLARCALSAVLPKFDSMTIGCSEPVCWTLRATGNLNPPQARYNAFWDVNLVFNLFKTWGPNRDLTMYRLTAKTTMLLLLLTAQRGQTIWRLNVSGLEILQDELVFRLKHMLKHNRPGEPLDTLHVPAYPTDRLLCPRVTVKHYLKRTREVRGNTDQLLIITRDPYTAASRDTVSRWTKSVLKWAGINTKQFSSHSTRGASTSKACSLGIDINLLLKQASWKNAETFGRHYNKSIIRADETLAYLVLNECQRDNTQSN